MATRYRSSYDGAYDGAFDASYDTAYETNYRVADLEAEIRSAQAEASAQAARHERAVRDLSGQVEGLNSGLNNLSDDLSHLESTLFGGLEALRLQGAEHLALTEQSLEVAKNPRATEAHELYRRGQRAVSNGWYVEGMADFRTSLEIDPYATHTRVALALALSCTGESEEAAREFETVSRYCAGSSQNLRLDVFAVLLASREWEAAGHPERQRELLINHAQRFGACPEFQIAAAAVTNDPAYLTQAFRVAPELSQSVVESGSSVDAPALELANDSTTTLAGVLEAHRLGLDVGIVQYSSGDPITTSTQGLLRHEWFLSTVAPILEAEVKKFRRDSRSAQEDAQLDTTSPTPPTPQPRPGRSGFTHLLGGVGMAIVTVIAALWTLMGVSLLTLGMGPNPSFGERVFAMFMCGLLFFIPAAFTMRLVLPRVRDRVTAARAADRARARTDRQQYQIYTQNVVQWQSRLAQRAGAEAWIREHEPLADRFDDLERALARARSAPTRLRMLDSTWELE